MHLRSLFLNDKIDEAQQFLTRLEASPINGVNINVLRVEFVHRITLYHIEANITLLKNALKVAQKIPSEALSTLSVDDFTLHIVNMLKVPKVLLSPS